MLRPKLRRQEPEEVTLLTAVKGSAGRLGEQAVTYVAGETHLAGITPLTAEEAVRLGLKAEVIRCRVRLPAGVTREPGDRVRFRGRDWRCVTVTTWRSFTLVVVEGV
ncbi:hypothetical protein DAETH_28910 [Deinococcus aetherius]|uniref:Phage protein n=1 Tax=Deinococcus aetherius TaxID=200252 RepID=A0ABM8AGK5_9DEIO|nr:head-tail adaptor protein [Deinococcus aetherius]BDP42922.1 hypothetical protein DAETH_28910 [Deinococcus aetherius]